MCGFSVFPRVAGERGFREAESRATDGYVITLRKNMLLDLRLPNNFIILAAGHREDSCTERLRFISNQPYYR